MRSQQTSVFREGATRAEIATLCRPDRRLHRRGFFLGGRALTAFHDRFLQQGDAAGGQHDAEIWRAIEINHRCNAALWAEEDKARRTDVPDAEIVACKRAIDRHNQRRNDAVEALDQRLLASLDPLIPQPGARLSSETAGAMVDRLSILALRIHHMWLQTQREDADEAHRRRCRDKLAVLVEQRADLAAAFDRLLWEVRCGTARFKTYRQFKMYNDPTLNPELYGRRPDGDASSPAVADALSSATGGREI